MATWRGGAEDSARGGGGAAAGASTVAGAVGRMTRGSVLGGSGSGLAATDAADVRLEEAAAVAWDDVSARGDAGVGTAAGATGRAMAVAAGVAGAGAKDGCGSTVTGARVTAGRDSTGARPGEAPTLLLREPGGVSRTGSGGLLNGSR